MSDENFIADIVKKHGKDADMKYHHHVNQRYYYLKNFLDGLSDSMKKSHDDCNEVVCELLIKEGDERGLRFEEFNKRILRVKKFNDSLDRIMNIINNHKELE